MNTTTPPYRRHSNIWCNCAGCKHFDYGDTMQLPRQTETAQQSRHIVYVFVEVLNVIDAETGERTTYYRPISA